MPRKIRVAVVGDDDELVAVGAPGLDHCAKAVVRDLHRFDNRVENTRVANHVRVGEIEAYEIGSLSVLALHLRDDEVDDFVGGHLWLEVIGRDLRTVGHQSTLSIEWNFAAATEEERDVGVLFRFGDAHLGAARCRDGFTERGRPSWACRKSHERPETNRRNWSW